MPENSVKCEKTPRTRAGRVLVFMMLFLMMGSLMFILYNSSIDVSLLVNFWRPRQFHNSMNTTVGHMEDQDSTPESHHSVLSSTPDHSTSQYFVAYPHQYHFIVDEPNRCQEESPFLVLMIPVASHNRQARDVIRSTWGNETTVLGQVVSHYFLLGLSGEGDGAEKEVLQESLRHRDILQSNFVDSYNNLTIKTMLMFEWLGSHCPESSYAMKVDSDMFLNVHNLVDMLLAAPRHLYITGRVQRNAPVRRDHTSKWFLPVSVFPASTYPPYAMGLGYVFSLDLSKKMLEASLHVKAIYIEDVYVGLCLRHMGIAPADPPHGGLFQAMKPYTASNCYWTSVITTVLSSPTQLSDVWGKYMTRAQSGC